MNSISIANPLLFLVVLPLLIAIVIGFFLLPNRKKKLPKNIISLVLHVVMCVTLAFSFVDLKYMTSSMDTELYIVADCSISTKENIEKMSSLIDDTYAQASRIAGTKIGVVAFGKDPVLLSRAGDHKRNIRDIYDERRYPEFDAESTDIKEALLYTNELYSDNVIRRMLVISDGIETDSDALEAIDTLSANDVYVDSVSISQDPFDEIAITKLDYVDRTFLGKEQSVKIQFKSMKETEVTLTLTSSGTLLQRETVTASRGVNNVTFPLPSNAIGTFEYEVKITGDSDTYAENNHMSFSQSFTDEYKVLFIGHSAEDRRSIQALGVYSPDVKIDYYLGVRDVPDTLDEMMKYDEIVLSDINIQSDLIRPETFVESLKLAVSAYGKSLVTYGATYSGKGANDYIADYNDMLPVQYESDEGKAIVLLIDNSGSMEIDSRLEMAKAGAIEVLDSLTDKDYLSVITFSDNAKIVQPLTSVKSASKIKREINRIGTDGGTVMNGGLEQAHNQLKTSTLENKFILVLSDGEPYDKPSDLNRKAMEIAADDIIMSCINISNDVASSVELLTMLSRSGNGTYYYCSNPQNLATIMVNSVVDEMINHPIVSEEEIPINFRTSDETIDEIDYLPGIYGYNFCRIKNDANTILTVTYMNEDPENPATAIVPLYAYWFFGNGKVSSFTSSLTQQWTSALRASLEGREFFANMTESSLPIRRVDSIIDPTYENRGKSTRLAITALDKSRNGKVHISVKDPTGEEKAYELRYDGKNYSGQIDSGIRGEYMIHWTYEYQIWDSSIWSDVDRKVEGDTSFFYDYSSEYDLFRDPDNSLLYDLSKKNGELSYDEIHYKAKSEELSYKAYKSSMLWFMLATVLIFSADVFVRKGDLIFKKKKRESA